MTTTAAEDLRTIALCWPDLHTALGAPTQHSWPPVSLRGYLAAMHQLDDEETEAQHWQAKAQRALERDPAQLGERPILIQARIFETMEAVRRDLLDCADTVAAAVQRTPMSAPKPNPAWPTGERARRIMQADRARRELLALKDARDPRRWQWVGQRPDGGYTALWLYGRVTGAPGPFDPLKPLQLDHVASVARSAARQVEQALDLADGKAKLERPCAGCGGRILIHGGAGARPFARCTACGRTWTEQDAVA